jgi:hypothetical protein
MLPYTSPKLAFFLIHLRAVATSRLWSNCETGGFCYKVIHDVTCVCMYACMRACVLSTFCSQLLNKWDFRDTWRGSKFAASWSQHKEQWGWATDWPLVGKLWIQQQNKALRVVVSLPTWCFSVARHLVCIGDCGITPFDGGIPTRPHNKTCQAATRFQVRGKWILSAVSCNYRNKREPKRKEDFCTTQGRKVCKKGICTPWTPKEVNHNGKKRVFSNWILSAELVEKPHCDQSSRALQSSLPEWKPQLYRELAHLACPVIHLTYSFN